MIIDGYDEKLDNTYIRYINYILEEKGPSDAIEHYIKDLDCTTVYEDGSRPRQTIDYGYRITLSSIEYILDKLYLSIESNPEKAQSYIDYRKSIIDKVINAHEKNINFEREFPVRYYIKKSRNCSRSSNRTVKSKDIFTGESVDVSVDSAKTVKPKAKKKDNRKAEFLNSKSINFAFGSFKIKE